MGVARGLVEVRVDADHEVEPGQGRVEAQPVGGGQHRVRGDGDDGADPALPRRLDLLGQGGHGQLGLGLGMAADPAAPAAEGEALAGTSGAWPRPGGGEREQGAAGAVEVAGEDVEHVDQPAGERAVLDGAAADPPVDGGGGRGRQIAGEGADVGGREVAGGCHGLRSETPERLGEFPEAEDLFREHSGGGDPLGEQGVGEGGQQQGVAAGARREVAVGEAGGAGAARVDDDEGAAAGPQRLEPAREVGGGAQRAVGLDRVRADEQQEVGAVEVGDRDGEGIPEEEPAGDVLGHLVERAGGEGSASRGP